MTRLPRRVLLRWTGLAALAACSPSSPGPTSATPAPGTTSPSTAPSPTRPRTASPAAAVDLAMVCRDAWGARAPVGPARDHTIRRLTVHHSATPTTTTVTGPAHLRAYQAFHMDDRGWTDIAYHVAVDRAGVVYELRDWRTVGDTSTAYDPTGHFLLLLDGNFDEHDVSDAQLQGAAAVLAWAADHFAVDLADTRAHRDLASTACPGDALYHRMEELLAAASAIRTTTGVQRSPRCGPEASAAVSTLESTGTVPALLR